MTDHDIDSNDTNAERGVATDPSAGTRRSVGRVAQAWLGSHGRIAKSLALVAVTAVIGAAYVAASPPSASALTVPTAAPVDRLNAQGALGIGKTLTIAPDGGSTSGAVPAVPGGTTQTEGQSGLPAAVDSSHIVKTGQISLEVADIDGAVGQAQTTITGLGGSVDSSNSSGSGDDAQASITFRVPAGKWDEALANVRKIGSKVLSMQTSSTDVTSQVIDLDARIGNLQKTEAALQAIMNRATAVADVLAVEGQLSQTQGQIEQLTAARDHLKNQAAMSTLTVTFQLPTRTVTTQAAQNWTLGAQIDEAGAALVRVGQGLVTIAVWICVVVLPLAFAGLVLLGFVTLIRRIFGRGRRRDAAAAA